MASSDSWGRLYSGVELFAGDAGIVGSRPEDRMRPIEADQPPLNARMSRLSRMGIGGAFRATAIIARPTCSVVVT